MNESLKAVFGNLNKLNGKPFFPQTYDCGENSQWCGNNGTLPVSGNNPKVAMCGSAKNMEKIRDFNGGLSGRGVTPCPFGYLQKNINNNEAELIPFEGKNFGIYEPTSTLFDPERPGFLPPQGTVRPLMRIGYEWRN